MSSKPDVSVVIPTAGRPESLRRTVAALLRQSSGGPAIEILVIADGDDATAREAALAIPPAVPVRVAALGRQRGAAAARNAGAELASAPLLVFLDDDIEASSGLVEAHLAAHQESGSERGRVVVGYLATGLAGRSFFAGALRGWWEAMFRAMRSPGHRFRYRDLLSGNFSIATQRFREAGGFDEAFTCHEDYELGARLIASGVDLAFSDVAAGVHHERTDLTRALARKRAEGAADVLMVRRHPDLLPTLPIGWFESHAPRRQHWLRALALGRPTDTYRLTRTLQRALDGLEAARLRGRWHRLLDDVLTCHYWLGVGEALSGAGEVERFLSSARAVPACPMETMTVDLASAGFTGACAAVDARRPEGLDVLWDGTPVGSIGGEPGAERLRGAHLQRALVGELAEPLLSVLDARGVVHVSLSVGGAITTREVPRAALASVPGQ